MRRIIIDDFRLQYLKDLFEKIDYFTIRVVYCNSLILYGRYVLQRESFLIIFSLDATCRSKIRIDQKRLFFPFHFSRTLPLIPKHNEGFILVLSFSFWFLVLSEYILDLFKD